MPHSINVSGEPQLDNDKQTQRVRVDRTLGIKYIDRWTTGPYGPDDDDDENRG
ncbi:hypothetical protein Vi05172_g10653 [Venturia inaequalis]|nr:hypothetical protein Vi05172_g10653 [Venturia inaequalis]